MKTVLHIVRRDITELASLVVLTTAAQCANVAAWMALGHFDEPGELLVVAQALPFVVALAILGLITATVHQDVIPGAGQDWLVRPIRRRDLMTAKLAFVALAVHVPMVTADAVHGAVAHVGWADSLKATIVHNAVIVLILDLPAIALASMTTTLTQVISSLLGTWLAVLACVVAGVVVRGGTAPPFVSSGLQWMTPTFWAVIAGVAALVIIPLQYFRRATAQARRIAVMGVLLAPIATYSTWTGAFALQQRLAGDRAESESIALTFEPGVETSAEPHASFAGTVSLPLLIQGLPPDSLLLSDRSEIRMRDQHGRVVFDGRTTSSAGADNQVLAAIAAGGEAHAHQRIALSNDLLDVVAKAPVRIELTYSLTLFRVEARDALAAVDGDRQLVGFGWCRSRIDEEGDDVEVGCLQGRPTPACVSIVLENPMTGRRNPEGLRCVPDYAPYAAQMYPDSVSHWGIGARFRDPHGLATFPVDQSQLSTARVVLTSYRPATHFTRRLVIPQLRPEQWATSIR